MSNSPSFPNVPGDSTLPDIGMSDPGHTFPSSEGVGGNSKIVKTDMSGPSSQVAGYGYMSPALKNVGQAPGNSSGVLTDNNGQGNSSGIPAAQPIEPMTYGDPNNSSVDAKDNHSPTGASEARYSFK